MKTLNQTEVQEVNGGTKSKSWQESLDIAFRKLAGIFETEK